MQNVLTNYSAPGRWYKGVEKRVCSYTGRTLNTQVSSSEFGEATSQTYQVFLWPSHLPDILYLFKQKEGFLTFLFPHQKTHTYPKAQSDL